MNSPADSSVKNNNSGLQNRGVNLNTVMIIGLAVGGFFYVRSIEQRANPSPVAQVISKQEADSLSDMFKQGIPVIKSGVHKNCVDLGNSIEKYLFLYFEDLSDPAKAWVDQARLRIGVTLGSQNLEQSKQITPQDREALSVLFQQLSDEASTLVN
jgi:hypothetical protein